VPYEIKFENAPIGICAESMHGPGFVKIRAIGFVLEEDGDMLVDHLEGFGSDILRKLPFNPPIQPSQVQDLLAIIRRDSSATVYLNELVTRGLIQVKKEIKAGDPIFADDIAEFHRLEFEGIPVPKDTGLNASNLSCNSLLLHAVT
jgi:hypothetical protein